MRTLFWVAVVLGLLLAIALAAAKYLVMPRIENYATDIQARVSQATGMDVKANTLRGGWAGFSPYVELTDLTFREPANLRSPTRTAGAVALNLPSVRASLSIPYLLIGQVRFREVSVFQPELSLIRAQDGLVYFAGRPLNRKAEADDGRLLDWLLAQPAIEIHRARLTWQDLTTPAPELVFTDVGIVVQKRFGQHDIGITAKPPPELARQLEVSGRVNIEQNAGRWEIDGELFAALNNANLSEFRRHLNVPDNWQAGIGSVRAWTELDNRVSGNPALRLVGVSESKPADNADGKADGGFVNPIKSIVADVHIVQAKAQLGDDLAPLNIAKLAGRLEYARLEGGFSVRSRKLEFRTKEGVVSPPADFAISLQSYGKPDLERGEITANGIDLKVMSALVDYFPIGKEVRQLAAKLGLRGSVRDSKYAWTGPIERPRTYDIKGTLDAVGVNTLERVPGFSGFTGSVEGNQSGGRYRLASKDLVFDAPMALRDPLRFEQIDGQGTWTVTGEQLTVKFDDLKIANRDLAASFNGVFWRKRPTAGAELDGAEKLGSIDATLRLERLDATRLGTYLPHGLTRTREYLDWAIRDGKVTDATLSAKGALAQFPFHKGVGGSFTVRAKLSDIDFRYSEGWPVANDINGDFAIDNTAIVAKVANARFYSARVRNTTVAIADTWERPAVLTISGEADARAEDVTRYIRESPMLDGVGGFVKYVAMDGPGRLNLTLGIPLTTPAPEDKRAPAKFTLSGRYQLNRGNARILLGGAAPAGGAVAAAVSSAPSAAATSPPQGVVAMSNLSGVLTFTEAGVKSSGITATVFGQPATVGISGGGEAGVTTEFSARADVQQLNGVLPFRIPKQVAGPTDFSGKLMTTRTSTDLIVNAPLVGVTSSLPFPLNKRADEARAIQVNYTQIGQPSEQLRVTLAGATPETRVEARFGKRGAESASPASGVFGGLVSIGAPVSSGALPEGVWLNGSMRSLDFDQWQRAIAGFYPSAETNAASIASTGGQDPIAGFDFALGQLLAYGRPFPEVKIRGRKSTDRNNPTWALSVSSRDAEGDFTWRAAAFSERGAVRARLKKLIIPDELAQPNAAPTLSDAFEAAQLPALDIVADEFTFKGRWLGKLELIATPQTDNWKIDRLHITNGHMRAEMSGIWQRYGDPFAPPLAGPVKSLTTMNVKLETNNLNALFGQFGHGEQIKGGRGTLEGKLSWPGHAYQFQLANLSGQFRVDAEKGQFAKIEAGAGKLLGLLSLQSIPRRLSFDFRDLFNEGFAFDRIEGDITIANGVMFAKRFDLTGPAADVKMAGDISLPTERQNLTLTVFPKVSGTAGVGAGALVNPVVGVAVWLVGGVLERVLSVQYSVTGTWDNPVIERIGRQSAPAAPAVPASATASTAAPPSAASSSTKPPASSTPAR
jgi:uncharacterized protein YhdP